MKRIRKIVYEVVSLFCTREIEPQKDIWTRTERMDARLDGRHGVDGDGDGDDDDDDDGDDDGDVSEMRMPCES